MTLFFKVCASLRQIVALEETATLRENGSCYNKFSEGICAFVCRKRRRSVQESSTCEYATLLSVDMHETALMMTPLDCHSFTLLDAYRLQTGSMQCFIGCLI